MKNKSEYVGSLWEEWRDIKGYEGLYQVSNEGRVRSLNYNRTGEVKVMKARKDKGGYMRVQLCKDGKRKMHLVHRLVYEAFKDAIPAGMEINHLDENPANNWLSNLEVCTPKENMNYGTRNERAGKAIAKANINNPFLCKAVYQIDRLTGEVLNTYPSIKEAHRQTGIDNSQITKCCLNRPKHKTAGGFIWRYDKTRNASF